MALDESPPAPHSYRCLEGGHTFVESRKPDCSLELRQTAWCWEHHGPGVLLSAPEVSGTAPTA